MKKTALILVVILFCNKTKAQHFGVTADLGMSRINKIYRVVNSENKPKVYYGIGVFFAKIPNTSKWGFRTSIDYNKRGTGIYYEGDWHYTQDGSYIVDETNESTKSLSIAFTPTFNVSKKFQLILGPSIGYTLGTKSNFTETYYKTETKSEILSSRTGTSEVNGSSFTNRLHFGLKAGINIKVSNYVDLGLTYQYARIFKYGNSYYRTFYNIVNISTSIYFKSRKPID
jgi:opacity protein-like surface antigen